MTRNKRFPRYVDDADYTTNAPSYYHDLGRKNKLLEKLAKKIWEYDERLNERLDELNTVLSSYLEQWDERIENLDKEVSHIFVTWLEDGTLEQIINHDVLGNKADKSFVDAELEKVTAQLAQTINPQKFEGSDAQKIQQAIAESEVNSKAIAITGIYDLKDETIYFDKDYVPRKPLRFVGGGTIMKSEEGFMFSSTKQVSNDIYFDNIYFLGNKDKLVRVFDCQKITDKPKIISVHTTNCFFDGFDNVYYSPNSYMQTVSMKGDTFVGIETAVFEIAGAFSLKATQLLVESMNGSFIKHRVNNTFLRLEQVTITDSTMEDFRGAPVFDLEDSRGLTIKDIYMENNNYGDIIFSDNANLSNVTIENVGHYAPTTNMTVDAMIIWGGRLQNCKSINNYVSNPGLAINDTRNVKIGVLEISGTEGGYYSDLVPVNNNTFVKTKNYTKVKKALDLTGSPGDSFLINGDEKAGFFGFVKPSEMGEFEGGQSYDGEQLAAALSFTTGNNQNSQSILGKYYYKGKILFIPLHSYKRSVSFDEISNANLAYANQNSRVTIGGHEYIVRLLRGVKEGTITTHGNQNLDIIGEENEYNELILPMTVYASTVDWRYEHFARNSQDLRIRPWGLDLTNTDLKQTVDDYGSYVWVAGTPSDEPNNRFVRGYFSVEYATTRPSDTKQIQFGWLPVLELVQ